MSESRCSAHHHPERGCLQCWDAMADEVERLRAEIAKVDDVRSNLNSAATVLTTELEAARKRIERLHKALREVREWEASDLRVSASVTLTPEEDKRCHEARLDFIRAALADPQPTAPPDENS